MLKIILAGVLILSSAALPASAEVGPGVGGGYLAYVCTNDTGGRLTVRIAPGQGNRRITQIPAGQDIRVLDSIQGNDGFQWYKVSYKGKKGWVRSDYVCNYDN
jgi:uncharacterized protein YgiM (DUF1202 family)